MAIDVLINDGHNTYKNVGGNIILRINKDTNISIRSKTDEGFKRICIYDTEKNITLEYKNGYYDLKE